MGQMKTTIIITKITIIQLNLTIVEMEYMNLNLMKIVTMEMIQVVKIVKLFMDGYAFLSSSIDLIVGLSHLLLLSNVEMENTNLILEKNVMTST